MKEKEQRYIELLLKRCMNIEKSKVLFISFDEANEEFVKKIEKSAKDLGVEEVYLDKTNIYETKKVLENIKKEEIKEHPLFDASIWNEYAKKGAAFLMIASEFPKVLDDIDPELIAETSMTKMKSKDVYRKMQKDNELVWLIAVYPNKVWAKDKFPELNENEAYEKLFNLMMEVTMCNEDNPIEKWNKQLEKQSKLMHKLNDLKIKTLHFTNNLGTDLTIGLNKSALWQSAGEDDNKIIVNMPSYEVFTSPDYRKTNGIVYSSKPLSYSSQKIDEFWIEFKDGEVINYDAKVGKDLLKKIIEEDEGSKRLGEVALVDKNSPIAKTHFIFGETCLDENAACHIALGASFLNCLEGASNMTKEQRDKEGLNDSKNHVDFMIGTNDLNIEAETENGIIQIFDNGEFCIK